MNKAGKYTTLCSSNVQINFSAMLAFCIVWRRCSIDKRLLLILQIAFFLFFLYCSLLVCLH